MVSLRRNAKIRETMVVVVSMGRDAKIMGRDAKIMGRDAKIKKKLEKKGSMTREAKKKNTPSFFFIISDLSIFYAKV